MVVLLVAPALVIKPSLSNAHSTPTAPCAFRLLSRPNTKQQAEDGMHALSKFLYDRLFEYLVYRINKVLKSPVEVKCFIGVLDIFGFEMFNQVRCT